MILANVPAVLLGNTFADRLPTKAIRMTAAFVFMMLEVIALAGLGK